MASTFYEDWGPTATTTDSVNRYHQNHLKVEWTSDDEQITYTLTAYARSGNGTGYYYCSGYGVTVTLYYNLNGEGWVKLNSASGTLNYNNNVAYVTKSVTFNRTHSRQTIQFGAWNTGNSLNNAWHTTGEDSFAALKSYSISYNKNSDNTVSNWPANQTKWYNENLTISSTKPKKPTTTQYTYTATFNSNYPTAANTNNYIETATVTGSTSYTFSKWATVAASTGGTLYNSGATYTPNTAATLYPRWTSSTSSPSITFKAYSLPNYTFQGWSTSSTGTTITYTPGATYTPTASSNVTWYGHWIINYKPPTINNEITAIRTTNDGTEFNEGTYCKISVSWTKGDGDISEIKWIIKQQNTIIASETTTNIATAATSANKILSGVDSTKSYTIEVTITDTNNLSATKTTILSPAFFTLDILQGGEGIAIGKPATITSVFDVGFNTQINNSITSTPVLTVSAVTINNITPTAVSITGTTKISGATTINGATTITGSTTISGATIIKSGTLTTSANKIICKSSNLTCGTSITANGNSSLSLCDSAGTQIGYLDTRFEGTNQYTRLITERLNGTTTAYNGIYFGLDNSGKPIDAFINANSQAAFQKALYGVADTSWAYLVGNSSSTNFCRWRCKSGWVQIEIYYGSGASLTAKTAKSMGTIPADYRPNKEINSAAYLGASVSGQSDIWVDSGGHVYIVSTVASSTFYGSLNYPLNV